MSEIALDSVTKSFGDVEVVKDMTLTVPAGEFTTLLGPSGCGKSTTLNMIAGLEDLTAGTITVNGRRVDDLPPDKRDLAFVFQDYALYPHMSVYGNIAFGLKMRKTSKSEIDSRVREAAQTLSIDHLLKRRPRALSGGQRQRVALGRALARHPSVFLFDEPLSNLDALLRDQTRSEIKRLHLELGTTSVYVTHDQEEAMALSDRIAVLNNGLLEQYGSPEEVYHRPATEFVAGFIGKPRMNIFDARNVELGRYNIAGTDLVVDAPNIGADVVRVGLRPEDLKIKSTPGHVGTNGDVRLVEPLGAVTDVIMDVGSISLTSRVPGLPSVAVGQQIWLDTAATPLHFFDAETGARI